MDVVYLVRHGRQNEELRYSLRSLRHLPHDRVWIAGGWPYWIANANLIAVPRTGSRYIHTTLSLIAAAEHPDVSEDFVVMNDDFYITSPIAQVEVHHRGEIGRALDGRTSNHYSRARVVIGEWLRAQGLPRLDYDLHAPMVLNRDKVLAMAEAGAPEPERFVFKRTVYGNLNAIGGTQIRDPKVRGARDRWDQALPYVSTAAHPFRSGDVGRFLREMLPDPSPYEVIA